MKYYLFLLLLSTTSYTLAQKQGNIWYFGNRAGLEFSSGSPIAITDGATFNESAQFHSEGTAVMCDSAGMLLFYTNGEIIWNREHEIMPNGNDLLGNLSSTQSSLIIAEPGSSQYFYVFTTDGFYRNDLKNGLRYSIVDICLDDGMGDVLENQKNQLLLDLVSEKLTATRHANGVDYWVITQKYNTNAFYAYLLTSTGITDTVVSNIGSVHKDYCSANFSTRSALGQLKVSPDGQKVACVSGQGCNNISELFDFDQTTGKITNPIQLDTDQTAAGLYGVSFSPDNSKLYISSWINNDRIYQYDLSSNDSIIIVNSKIIIADHMGGPRYMGMQLGPDGKIYVAMRNQSYIAVINQPNLVGIESDFEDVGVSLNGAQSSIGLPNFVDFYDYSNTIAKCANSINIVDQSPKFKIYPNPFNQSTQIQFSGYKNEKLEIIIYNTQGKIVRRIDVVNNDIEVKRGDLTNGIYFCQLRTDKSIIGINKLIIY